MITEDYVSFETAKLLKEKGFNGVCRTAYETITNKHEVEQCSPSSWGELNQVKRPTLQMATKWLREVHNLFIFISTWLRHKDGTDKHYTVQYYYEIRNLNDEDFETIAEFTVPEFDSPEKTCEAALKYCLQNLI